MRAYTCGVLHRVAVLRVSRFGGERAGVLTRQCHATRTAPPGHYHHHQAFCFVIGLGAVVAVRKRQVEIARKVERQLQERIDNA